MAGGIRPVLPWAASTAWYATYFEAIRNGFAAMPPFDKRDMARTLIGAGPELRVLTIPLEGGSAVLKRDNPYPFLSGHGKWRREHIGAWTAAYGKTPYFQHLMPEIERIYEKHGDGSPLEEFNRDFHRLAVRWLEPAASAALPEGAEGLCRELSTKVNGAVSIFEALFRFGKEAGFGLR